MNVSSMIASNISWEYNNNKHHIKYTVHQNLYGNRNKRKPWNFFLYIVKKTFIGSTKLPILQLQLQGGYDPLFTGSNLKEATTQILYLQPKGG
jgi:hypothetical protein